MPDPVLPTPSATGAEYRYFFQYPQESASVGDFAGELQGIYGVNMTKYISRPGDMTFSIRLDNWINSPDGYTPPADVVLPITEPYGSSVWVHRNGVLVWGGLVSSRTWQSQGRVMNFTARTHDSYLERVHANWSRLYINNAYPANMIYEIVRRTNAFNGTTTNPSFSIHYDWTHVSGHPNYTKEVRINSTSGLTGPQYPVSVSDERAPLHRELIDEAIRLGAEYRLKWYHDDLGPTPRWVQYETGQQDGVATHLVGTARADASIVLQYPGSIYRYWWPESMGKNAGAAGVVVMRGKRDNVGVYPRRNIFQDLYEADGTTPISRLRVTARLDFDTTSQTNLNNADPNTWLRLKPPMVEPTFEIDLSHAAFEGLGAVGLDVGDFFKLIISDPMRFGSEVKKGTARCVGWSLTPPSESSVEQFGVDIEEFLEDD